MEFLKQILSKIVAFITFVCGYVAKMLNVSLLYGYVIVGALALLVLILIIVIISAIVKGCKKKKAQNDAKIDKADGQQVKSQEPAEEVVEITTDSASVEEVTAPVEEVIAPVETQLAKEEVATATETVQEVKDDIVNEQVENERATEKTTEKPKVKAQTKSKTSKTTSAKKEKAPAKKVEKEEAKPTRKLNGKWVIESRRENEFTAKLIASNGEVMLNSEVYASADGARNGIATIINGVKNGKFVIYNVKSGEYYFKLKSAGNKLLCAGEIYKTKDGCTSAVETVKRIAEGSPIANGVLEGQRFIDYTPESLGENAGKGAKGKWKLEQTEEGGFLARLYANNGQLMLSTEEVSKKATALSAVESVKKNALEGNFIIDKDKFGRFYYKLRNSKKSVICIGEAYKELDSCISALESVRKFALNSSLQEN